MTRKSLDISYTEWISLVNSVKEQGLHGETFSTLQNCYPKNIGTVYEKNIQSELAKFETIIMKKTIDKFQTAINLTLEEQDLEILQTAVVHLKKDIRKCLFFLKIEEFPQEFKESMYMQIYKIVSSFQSEIEHYITQIMMNNASGFIEDLAYIFSKQNLKKYVMECKKNA